MIAVTACGAENMQAPRPQKVANAKGEIQSCQSFEQLMPAFVKIVSSGKMQNLATMVQGSLLAEGPQGTPPPMTDVLRAIFSTLGDFARLPPERGAPEGELCIPTPETGGLTLDAGIPPPNRSHPMCEMRRALDVLVHQGAGIEALKYIDPQIAGAVNYIIGRDRRGGGAVQPHYEVAGVISNMCQQNVACQMSDTLDLLIGFTAWLETPQGRASLDKIDALIKNPGLEPFLNGEYNRDAGTALGGEAGVIALAQVVIDSILGMQRPEDLDALLNNPLLANLPADLRADITAVTADTKLMLDPARSPNILRPLKRVLNCYKVQDSVPGTSPPQLRGEVILMIYRLALVEKLPEFGFTRLLESAKGLRDTDERGTLVHLGYTLAKTIREDELAIDSAAAVCHAMFSNQPKSGQTRSNAELALPVVADLFAAGIGAEAMCAVDTLVYGCSGGAQPACALRDGGR